MRPLGLCLILFACLLPLLWMPGLAQPGNTVALFSQYLGMLALITMALAQIIATRLPGIEPVFGALDQSYRLHKWLGISGMVAVLLHDTIDADMRGLGPQTALTELAETAGEVSLYGLLILVIITITTFIPYHLWKWTHRLIGAFFVMGAFHTLFILKPFANGDPVGMYISAVCLLGTLAYLYTSAPRSLRSARRYRITRIRPTGGALSVDMSPVGRPLRHRAGQFAFFGFAGAGMAEPHPFTISSAPRVNGDLRVTIAPLGDLTTRLSGALEEGQQVRVTGPHGRFGAPGHKPQVWIAAGIGITPFAALAADVSRDGAPVTLIYCVRCEKDAAHLQELRALASVTPDFRLVLWDSKTQGRLTPRRRV